MKSYPLCILHNEYDGPCKLNFLFSKPYFLNHPMIKPFFEKNFRFQILLFSGNLHFVQKSF